MSVRDINGGVGSLVVRIENKNRVVSASSVLRIGMEALLSRVGYSLVMI